MSAVLRLFERRIVGERAQLTAQQLRRGVFRSTRSLETTIRNYIDNHKKAPKPFIWTKSADKILASVARFCQRTLKSAH
jgi:hypothetical protein